jgi:threonine aldolase
MRRAMADAEVGDDGYGEDPTVNLLEERFAQRMGKAAAIFVPSGTMANQIAVRVLAPPGTLVIAGRRQHVVAYELGAVARNASVQFHTVDDEDGTLDPSDIAEAKEATEYHQPEVSLVCVENTHMGASGSPWSLADLQAVRTAAAGTPIHMDGARLFNAEIATGVSAHDYANQVTTVMSCLSKGLCAPVGSLLAGPGDLMAAGRVERKRLGGAMRQAGVLAAAGLIAIDEMVERLVEDHDRAATLAAAVAERWPGVLDPLAVRTNIVTFPHPQVPQLLAYLRTEGVLAGSNAPGFVRLVTHHDSDGAGIERAGKALQNAPELFA